MPFRSARTATKVGYIPLDRFNETAAQEVQDAVRSLQKQNVRGIVLDFRGNPGSILDQSLAISSLFLKDGQGIASIRARNGETQPYVAHGTPALPTTPLVVLTDEYTASASESLPALRDHDRALIIGQTSFGKGLVQSVFNLDGGYALRLTTAKWYRRVVAPFRRNASSRTATSSGRHDTSQDGSVKKNRPS
jgi:carboxyl-terminal processing protease